MRDTACMSSQGSEWSTICNWRKWGDWIRKLTHYYSVERMEFISSLQEDKGHNQIYTNVCCTVFTLSSEVLWRWSPLTAENQKNWRREAERKTVRNTGTAWEISVNYRCFSMVLSETLWSPVFSPSRFCENENIFSRCSVMKAFPTFLWHILIRFSSCSKPSYCTFYCAFFWLYLVHVYCKKQMHMKEKKKI